MISVRNESFDRIMKKRFNYALSKLDLFFANPIL